MLTDWQARQAAIRPELALAAAHLVADDFAGRGHDDVVVRADSWVSFNGRQRQRMIDPQVDLASLSRRARAATYVLPLDPAGAATEHDGPAEWLLPLVPVLAGAVAVVVAVRSDDDEPAAIDIDSSAADFSTLDELVAASDLVVVATVADVTDGTADHARRPTRTPPCSTRLLVLDVSAVLAGSSAGDVIVEEPAALATGRRSSSTGCSRSTSATKRCGSSSPATPRRCRTSPSSTARAATPSPATRSEPASDDPLSTELAGLGLDGSVDATGHASERLSRRGTVSRDTVALQ